MIAPQARAVSAKTANAASADTKHNEIRDDQAKASKAHMMPVPDLRLLSIYGSYSRCTLVRSTKQQRIMSNLHFFPFKIPSCRRIWKRTMKCSAMQSQLIKKFTSSSGELLVHQMQLLHEEPVFDQRLVRSCVYDRTKHTETLVCESQESQGPGTISNKDAVAPAAGNLN
jgi:hypothetical protein